VGNSRTACTASRRHEAASRPVDALKPWQHRPWIYPRDPDFAVKAARVLDLYARVRDGEPLGENDYVLSADEKPCMLPVSAVVDGPSPSGYRNFISP
jgi:hypothetical protein